MCLRGGMTAACNVKEAVIKVVTGEEQVDEWIRDKWINDRRTSQRRSRDGVRNTYGINKMERVKNHDIEVVKSGWT